MVFDGRYYGGALPIPPVQYHPNAQAAGELAAGGLRAAYLYAQHQATLIGSQTWPMRHRRAAAPVTLSSTSMQRVAEWTAVHLAEHHTHCVAEFWWSSPQVAGAADVLVRAVATDGTATATGTTLTTTLRPESEGLLIAGQRAYVSQVAVDVSSLTRPTAAGRVYLEAYAVLGGSAHVIAPLQATAWRVTVP